MHPDVNLARLDRLIATKSILAHPFYLGWQQGTLNRRQLQTYAATYYPHVASFPSYLEAAAAITEDAATRAELEQNLADELSSPAPHAALWLDFAEGLGLSRGEVCSRRPQPAAAAIVATFSSLAKGTSLAALAALYAYESQQPEVARQKLEGLRRHYGVTSPQALAYFEVHAERDLQHRAGERKALSRSLSNGASADTMLDAAHQALQAYWELLDGICREAAIPLTEGGH